MTTDSIIRGKTPGPWSMLLYGVAGIGKSTLASQAPKPFFLDLEDGLRRVDCERTPLIRTWQDFLEWTRFAYGSDYATIVVDTAGALEQLLTTKLLESSGKQSLADFGYGKGYEMLAQEWNGVLKILGKIKDNGKNILIVGHDNILKFEDPTSDNYDRYTVKLDKRSAAMVIANVDCVLFARHDAIIKSKADGTKKMAVGTGERTLHTLESPAIVAKNRFGLGAQVPMNSEIFSSLI
jgi:AAA domain-containing protein